MITSLEKNTPSRLLSFTLIWFGQAVSTLGSGLTAFGLGVWVFEKSGSVTHYALIGLAAVLPAVLLSPFIGPLIDRWERKKVMMLSDSGAGLCSLGIATLLLSGRLELWHIYLLVGAGAAFGSLQWPAYMALVPHLVRQEHLGRANGLVQVGQAAAQVLAPALAGALLLKGGLGVILAIDFASYAVAILTLISRQFPAQPTTGVRHAQEQSWMQEIAEGWGYITRQGGLRGLLAFTALVNFLWSMVAAVIAPMILGFAGSDELGVIISIAGTGMLAGGVVMSVWGGPKRRIHGVLAFEMLSGAFYMLIGWQPRFWPVALGVFGAHFTIAIVSGSNLAIWQSLVPGKLQGRAFATQQAFSRAAAPLAYLLAGPLVEGVFEPWMASGGAMSGMLGGLVGSGPGRGIALLFLVMGVVKILVSGGGYFVPAIREIEAAEAKPAPQAPRSGSSG